MQSDFVIKMFLIEEFFLQKDKYMICSILERSMESEEIRKETRKKSINNRRSTFNSGNRSNLCMVNANYR